ncbi:hypothetical protein [Halostagnicola bangensis]
MAIPGYDSTDVHEIALEYQADDPTALDSIEREDNTAERGAGEGEDAAVRERARAAIVADAVPDSIRIRESDREAPDGALTEPVEIVGLGGVDGLEAIQLTLEYDPAGLPPGASPTDVAVGLETPTGYDQLPSEVDLEKTTVTAILPEPPSGETVVAMYEKNDEKLVSRVE